MESKQKCFPRHLPRVGQLDKRSVDKKIIQYKIVV